MADKIEIELLFEPEVEKGGLKKGTKEAEKAGKEAGKKYEKGFKKGVDNLKESFLDLKNAAAAAVVIGTFTAGIRAAIAQEEAVTRLTAALKVNNDFSEKALNNYKSLASELQQTTRFGDELILDQIALAKSFGATNEQAEDVVKAAVDLAEAFNIDLSSATRNAAKTLGGYAGELGEVIPELKDLTTEQLRAGEGVKLLGDRFAGTAKQRATSFGASIDQLSNSFGDALEGIGQFITENQIVIDGIKVTTSVLGGLSEAFKGTAKIINSAFKDDSTKALDVVNSRLTESAKRISLLQDEVKENLAFPQKSLFGGETQYARAAKRLTAEIESLREQRKKDLAERAELLKQANEQEANFEKDKNEKILFSQQQLQSALTTLGLTEEQRLLERQMREQDILKAAYEQKLIDQTEYLARKIELERMHEEQRVLLNEKAAMNAEATAENIIKAWKLVAKNQVQTAGQIASTLNTLAVNGFGNAFKKIGNAIASGQSVNEAFVQSAKQTASELASAFGDYYIKKGIAISADPTSPPGAGVPLIAAGAGLKLLSGVLGGSSDSGSSSSSGASTVSATSDVEVATDFDTEEIVQANERTGVSLTVQGSIFNTSETARDLTNLLNENFRGTGAFLEDARLA